MGRKAFKDFIQIKNLRNGAWVDGKMVSVNFDLHAGPFSIYGISWHVKSGSIRFPCPGKLKVMRPYIKIIREMVVEAVKERQTAKPIAEID